MIKGFVKRLNALDIVIIIAVAVLIAGLGYRRMSPKAVQIVNANTVFYSTFLVEKVRDFSIRVIEPGDVFYEQYGQQPLGTVIETWTEPAYDIMKKEDGTAVYAPVEGKYNLFVKLESVGSVSENGFYFNGNNWLSEDSELKIQSNMVVCLAKVYRLSTDK